MKNKLGFVILIIVSFVIFRTWLSFDKTLSSGDWPYLYEENIKEFKLLAQPSFLWLEPYYQATAKIGVQIFSLTWEVTEKIFWFIPLILLNLFSSLVFLRFLFKELKIENTFFVALGSFIYLSNTYFLMLAGGGQMGVAVSYSMAPLTTYFLIRLIRDRINSTLIVLSSFALGIQLMFDPRVFLLSVLTFLIYFLLHFYFEKINSKKLGPIFLVLLISFILNLFWIVPNVTFYKQEYTLIATEPLASFLSFATFSNSISFLHPNWPENIFGKIGFMKPEFIPLAILPYITLLFVNIKNKKESLFILSFAFIGLTGAFLAKGVNPPFGEIYEIFSNIPSSSLFRDPTKFYVLTAISYSVLIPVSIYFVSIFFNKTIKNLGTFFACFFCIYLLILIKPALLGELAGTFSPREVPSEYITFKNFIISQESEFNTLWVPSVQRFGLSVEANKAIAESDIFYVKETSSAPTLLNRQDARRELKENNIKYIVVPYDSLQEIFIDDRKFDSSLYEKTIRDLKKISWLSLVGENGKSKFGRIVVFEVNYK